jgi:hypothetical protein
VVCVHVTNAVHCAPDLASAVHQGGAKFPRKSHETADEFRTCPCVTGIFSLPTPQVIVRATRQ